MGRRRADPARREPYGDNGENKGLTVWLTVWTVWHLQPYGLYGAHSNPEDVGLRGTAARSTVGME